MFFCFAVNLKHSKSYGVGWGQPDREIEAAEARLLLNPDGFVSSSKSCKISRALARLEMNWEACIELGSSESCILSESSFSESESPTLRPHVGQVW